MTGEKYIGFGHEHTAAEWAKILELRTVETFIYYVEAKGLTVEELFDLRGLKYPEPKERKPREGSKMKDTQVRIYKLLVLSGYVLTEGLESVTVKPKGKNGDHLVIFKNHIVGTYNYRKGELKFNNGGGLPLKKVEDLGHSPRIRLNEEGFWEAMPETKRVIWQLRKAEQANTEPTQEEYAVRIMKYQKN